MIDTEDRDRWIGLGKTKAWCWQQGCMLQWLPGSKTEVIWNDRENGRFVSHILDVNTRKKRTLPTPVYALSTDGRWAVAPNFSRLKDCRPGYGYAGVPDKNASVQAPENDGIWRINLQTGERKLIIPFAAAYRIPYKSRSRDGRSSRDHRNPDRRKARSPDSVVWPLRAR